MQLTIEFGRVGEPLHAFSLEDILNGAVQESGLFPELYESPWPTLTAGCLVSGVERKFREHNNVLRSTETDFPLFLPAALLPKALEDSKEEEANGEKIAEGKLERGFITPVQNFLLQASPKEIKDFERRMQNKTGSSLYHLLAIADDRQMAYPHPEFAKIMFSHFSDHWNPQVREAINLPNSPAQRVKETDGALYGAPNSMHLLAKTADMLREKGITFDETYTMDTVLCIKPVVQREIPFPEQGLIVKANGLPFRRKPVTDKDISRIEKGRILTYDHQTLVDFPGVEKGTTLEELKRKWPYHPFFKQVYSPSAAMLAFTKATNIPQQTKTKRRYFISRQQPKTVIASARLLTAAPPREDVLSTIQLPNNMRLSRRNGNVSLNLRGLEEYSYSGQAFVLQNPDKFSTPDNFVHTTTNIPLTPAQIKILRILETDLIYAYLLTMSTQAGAPNHIGRSHMVEKSYFKTRGLWHSDFCNLGLAGDEEREAFRLYDTAEELVDGLGDWDRTTYQHDTNMPANDFLNEKDIKKLLGIKDFGYVVSGYGSASSFIDNAYKDAFAGTYRLSQLEGLTTVHGGGTRSAMLGITEGALQATQEGYHVLNLGIRSEGDVSPLEGNIERWIKSQGYAIQEGKDDRHFSYADGQMHILKLSRLLQRQAPIAALSNTSIYYPGGKGTVLEIALTKLHNALVEFTGQGLFPGFSSNARQIPMAFVDHEFTQFGRTRTVFEKIFEMDEDHQEMLNMHRFIGKDRVEQSINFIRNHAQENGYELVQQRPSQGQSASPAPSCS